MPLCLSDSFKCGIRLIRVRNTSHFSRTGTMFFYWMNCSDSVCFRSHPSDFKHRFHRHHSSSSLHGTFNHNHVQDTNTPLVDEDQDENQDNKEPVYDPKQDVFTTLFVSFAHFHKNYQSRF